MYESNKKQYVPLIIMLNYRGVTLGISILVAILIYYIHYIIGYYYNYNVAKHLVFSFQRLVLDLDMVVW